MADEMADEDRKEMHMGFGGVMVFKINRIYIHQST
jgi:hypothetical protein